MHRTLIRLPAVVALALPALALPLAASVGPALASEPPLAATAVLRSANEPASPPTPSSAPSVQGMEGMEGMDHGAAAGVHTEHGGGPAEVAAGPAARPRAAVLSSFAVVNGAVLITAGLLRRRDRARQPRRQRRSTPPTTA